VFRLDQSQRNGSQSRTELRRNNGKIMCVLILRLFLVWRDDGCVQHVDLAQPATSNRFRWVRGDMLLPKSNKGQQLRG
jgi:hypothetical protein